VPQVEFSSQYVIISTLKFLQVASANERNAELLAQNNAEADERQNAVCKVSG